MRITLIRHTTLAIEEGICYGQTDVDVSADFEREASALCAKLANMQFDAIYTSPLQRCYKLAEALCEDKNIEILDAQVKPDARLKELHFGDWELQPWDNVPRDVFDIWANDYANLAPPNGETFNQLQQRAKAFVAEVNQAYPLGHVLVVAHGGLIRALIADALELPLKRLFRIQVEYASLTQVTFPAKDAAVQVPKVHFINR